MTNPLPRLYVGNLPFSLCEENLRALFETAGSVRSVKIVMDRFSKKSRGYGFVEMATSVDAQSAITKLNGLEVDGRPLTVSPAKAQNSENDTLDPPHLFDREDRFRTIRAVAENDDEVEESLPVGS